MTEELKRMIIWLKEALWILRDFDQLTCFYAFKMLEDLISYLEKKKITKEIIKQLEDAIKEWLERIKPLKSDSEHIHGMIEAYQNVLEFIEDIKQ